MSSNLLIHIYFYKKGGWAGEKRRNIAWAGEIKIQVGEREIFRKWPFGGRSPAESGRVGVTEIVTC